MRRLKDQYKHLTEYVVHHRVTCDECKTEQLKGALVYRNNADLICDECAHEEKERVYIAGPMRGLPNYNFPAFDEAADRGRQMGFEIVSPAELDRAEGFDETKDQESYFNLSTLVNRDIQAIRESDAIALLPGWENSTGAQAELAIAKWLKKEVLDARTFEHFPTGYFPLEGWHFLEPTKAAVEQVKLINNGDFKIRDTGNRRVFSTGAQRDTGDAKGMPRLIPYEAIERWAKHAEAGGQKYGFNNWQKGIPLSVFADSALRHAFKLANGWTDEDHAAAVMWNVGAYIWTEAKAKAGKLPAELLDHKGEK